MWPVDMAPKTTDKLRHDAARMNRAKAILTADDATARATGGEEEKERARRAGTEKSTVYEASPRDGAE